MQKIVCLQIYFITFFLIFEEWIRRVSRLENMMKSRVSKRENVLSGMFLLCRGKSQSGVKLALQCFLQSGLCISTRLAGAGPLVIRTGIS